MVDIGGIGQGEGKQVLLGNLFSFENIFSCPQMPAKINIGDDLQGKSENKCKKEYEKKGFFGHLVKLYLRPHFDFEVNFC